MKILAKTLTLFIAIGLTTVTHAEQWVHLQKTADKDIYVNVDARDVEVQQQRYKQAWIKSIALQANNEEGLTKGDYTQALWRFDCANATSSILSYVDYHQNGQVMASGMFDASEPNMVLPNTVAESAMFAVCDGKYPQNAKAKANTVKVDPKKVSSQAKANMLNASTVTKASEPTKQKVTQSKEAATKKVADTKANATKSTEAVKKQASVTSQKVNETKTKAKVSTEKTQNKVVQQAKSTTQAKTQAVKSKVEQKAPVKTSSKVNEPKK